MKKLGRDSFLSATVVIERLKSVLRQNEIIPSLSDLTLAKYVGVGHQTIRNYKTRNKIPYDIIVEQANQWGVAVSLDDIILGRWNFHEYWRLLRFHQVPGGEPYERPERDRPTDSTWNILLNKRREASWGPGRHVILTEMPDDTMSPTISKGDLLVVNDHADTVESSGIYTLAEDPGFSVRRLLPAGADITVICDNNIYPSSKVPRDSLRVSGRVLKIFKDAI